MPKSKRNRLFSLTSTRKKYTEQKVSLISEIRNCVDNYARIFVFSVENMRNSKLKDLRQQCKQCRFFFGKNKVMSIALGVSVEDEYRNNLSKLSKQIYGQCGLFFTNQTKQEVITLFDNYLETDFARSGNIATESITLDCGPLKQFSHALEPHLRQLGLPTTLNKGIITLTKDYELCKEGDSLTPEQTKLLKLFDIQMSEFKIKLEAMWSNDASFELFKENSKIL